MVTPTTTIGTTTTTFGSCAAERDQARSSGLFDFALLYQAFRVCRRGKRGTRKAQRYEMRLLDNLVTAAQALRQRVWRPSRAIRFVVRHPKPREILAADFGDRVVHHLLVPWFERRFEPVFIHDSFANRRGKGSHAAVARLQGFTCAQPEAFFLQLDIANFFNRINRRRLFELLTHRVNRDQQRPPHDPRHADPSEAAQALWLARVLLTGNPAETACFQGRPAELARVPPHKQLINAPPETGLPIGNLTSQFFANVYLNELDQFIKHRLKVRHYVRYVDDFVLIHPDRAQLETWRAAIAGFLGESLGLELRDAGRLAPVANGIDFLGYIVRPAYRLVRRRVVGHLHERLNAQARVICRSDGVLDLAPGRADAVQATLASYLGHFRHAQSARPIRETFERHPWLTHLLSAVGTDPVRLQRTDRPSGVTSLTSQWRYFARRYPGHVVLIQVGNRLETYGDMARWMVDHVGARPVTRVGLGTGSAWPVARGAWLRRRLRRQCLPYCQVVEDGYLPGGLKRRVLRWLYSPPVPAAPTTG